MVETVHGGRMRRSVMVAAGVIEIEETAIPPPGGDEVLVRIERVGICGSDVHVYHGVHPYTCYPITQGHEFAGVVVECGAEVRSIRPGMRVTAPPQVVCGQCYQCLNGSPHICQYLKVLGFQTGGAAQDYFVLRASALVPVPDSFTAEHGALVEPVAVAVHALRRAQGVAGMDVLVLGGGTIGNLVAQAARFQGARNVLVTDVNERRLELARQCGVEYVSKADDSTLEASLASVFGSKGADRVLECVGAQQTIAQAVANVRKGGLIVVVGVFGRPCSVDFGLVQDRELQVIGSLMYAREDFVEAVELLRRRAVQVEPLLGRQFPLEGFAAAYDHLDTAGGEAMKVMIDLTA